MTVEYDVFPCVPLYLGELLRNQTCSEHQELFLSVERKVGILSILGSALLGILLLL